MNYKNTWLPNHRNEDFWAEVLVGRTIKDINYDDVGITSFVLDNGEVLYINRTLGTVFIKTEDQHDIPPTGP